MIESLIRSLGINRTYQGYRYVVSALELCTKNENYLLSMSKSLYPKIAAMYNTKTANVESNIRTVIKVGWERNGKLLNDISPYSIDCKPSNGEFLDIIVTYIQTQKSTNL